MALGILTSQSDKLLRDDTDWLCDNGFAMLVLVYIIVNYFLHPDVPAGWSSTIASLFLMGGFIIMSLGIVGIYVGNIFMQTKGRPLYVTRKILNENTEKNEGENQ